MDHEIAGTIDLLMAERYIDADRENDPHEPIWIRDIKTGRTPWKYRRQLDGLAALAAKTYGATSANVGILHCTDEEIEKSIQDQLIEKRISWRLKELDESGIFQEPDLEAKKMMGMDKQNDIFGNLNFEAVDLKG